MSEKARCENGIVDSAGGLFAVIRQFGASYESEKPLEAQRDWEAHRHFMNGLKAEGLVRLGSPLEGTGEVLLVFCAKSKDEIARRLDDDPWTRSGLLSNERILRWNLRLGAVS